jgi:outer membrane protein assembly factor BamE (lipoprotein component of BamABCDE complex)
MKKAACSCLVILLLVGGCATTEIGHPVNYAAAQKIEIGKTTKAQVLALLGSPVKSREFADGSSELVYGHLVAKGYAVPFYARGHAEGEKIAIKFGPDGIVKDIEKTKLQR